MTSSSSLQDNNPTLDAWEKFLLETMDEGNVEYINPRNISVKDKIFKFEE